MKQQRGAALVVVLSMLAMSLMLGLSGMQSSLIDERLAGNYKAASEAQMAAEMAASQGVTRIASPTVSDAYPDPVFIEVIDFKPGDYASFAWLNSWDDFSAFGLQGGELNDAHGGEIVSSDPREPSWAYRFVEGSGGRRYVVAMGAISDGAKVLSQSEPVIVSYSSKFNFNRALSVFGGIQDINSPPSWYPNSANAGINGGDDGQALFYEGEAHDCESSENRQQCYEGLHLYGGVTYGGEENTEARSMFEMLYNSVDGAPGDVVKESSDIEWIDRNADCSEEGVYQVAVLETFSAANNKKFCGLLVVWGGYVNIDDNAVDVTLSGNENVDGTLIVGNYAKDFDADNNPIPDFTQPVSEVDLTINGGGANGSVFFNLGVIWSSMLELGVSEEEIEELFPAAGGGGFNIFPDSWR